MRAAVMLSEAKYLSSYRDRDFVRSLGRRGDLGMTSF